MNLPCSLPRIPSLSRADHAQLHLATHRATAERAPSRRETGPLFRRAQHPRDWDKENVHYNPVHYLALLERKPGALDFGKPFDDWDLPEGFRVLRRRLEGELGNKGRREFIKVLRLLESCELGELAKAIDRSLQIGTLMAEAIQLLLQDGREIPEATTSNRLLISPTQSRPRIRVWAICFM